MNILVPNLGSTSVKYCLLEMPAGRTLAGGRVERVSDFTEAVSRIDTGGARVDAVAFKTVHGGPRFRSTCLIDAAVLAAMEEYLPAAPAHNAIYLEAIRAFRVALPETPMVAAFETEFHVTMPEYAARYGVPAEWVERHGVRKYGFHGASHRSVCEQAAEALGKPPAELRIVSCHLGGSCSVCAIDRGRSVDTTMGFSPQSGLEHATRHGDLDVFAVLFLMERCNWSVSETRRRLAGEGGLAGISGIAGGDVRDLEAAAEAGDRRAALALDVFAYGVRKTIGAYAAAMGGLDAIAFTGGIGENSVRLRAMCCAGLEFLGVRLDPDRNQRCERLISDGDSPVAVLVLAAAEELIVARRAYALLAARR